MPLDDALFKRIDLALRQVKAGSSGATPAARKAARKKAEELIRRSRLALNKARAALSRARQERRASQSTAHGVLKGAALVIEKYRLQVEELRGELSKTARTDEPNAAESALELSESRETVVNLILELSRERRRWKAILLTIRRRIKGAKPSAKRATKRLDELQAELAESQETAAKLLVELTRKHRSADAAQRLEKRSRRRPSDASENRGYAVAPAIAVAASRFDEGLRAVIESPAMDPESISLIARQGMALTRTLRLAAEIADGQPASSEPGALVLERLNHNLDLWEAEAGRRRVTVLRRFNKNIPDILVPIGGFEHVLDEFFGGAIGCAPRGTVVVIAAEPAGNGGVNISLQDAGSADQSQAPAALENLAYALCKELVERWGGKLSRTVPTKGKGRLSTLSLAGVKAES